MPYPTHVGLGLGTFTDYFIGAPLSEELDDNGAFSKEALAQTDKLILNMVGMHVAAYKPIIVDLKGTDPNNRWRVASCLQKSIRFCMPEMAQKMASVLYDLDRAYLFRRLGIIAVEDVGAGSFYAMLATLGVLSSSAWRQTVDERRLGMFLAKVLAEAPKDRSFTDLVQLADLNPSVNKHEMAHLPPEQLEQIATTPTMGWPKRMVAAWLLGGTKRHGGETMPEGIVGDLQRYFALLVKRGCPRAMLYIAKQTSSRIGESLLFSTLFIHEMLSATKQMEFEAVAMPAGHDELVGKLLGASYDMYTREGKSAIGYFRKKFSDQLAPFMGGKSADQGQKMLYFGLFVFEGGMLAKRAVYSGTQELRDISLRLELEYAGVPVALQDDFRQVLQSNLGALNECRKRVLLSSQQ